MPFFALSRGLKVKGYRRSVSCSYTKAIIKEAIFAAKSPWSSERKIQNMKKIRKTGIASVDALYNINITGNIIPHTWYQTILTKTGKPDMKAMAILSEILYWHRPRESCGDGDPGEIVLEKKFEADKLQLSYSQLQKKFNLSKAQCRRAMDNLERLGLIRREFRTIETVSGVRLSNVMYIELLSDNLLQLTFPQGQDPGAKNVTRSSEKNDKVIDFDHTGSDKTVMTNTENTTKISTEIINKDDLSIYQAELERVRNQIEYDCLITDRKIDRGIADNIVEIMIEVNMTGKKHLNINGEPVSTELVKARLGALDMDMVKFVIDKLKTTVTTVSNTRSYLLTVLFNAPATYETELSMQVSRDMYANSQ